MRSIYLIICFTTCWMIGQAQPVIDVVLRITLDDALQIALVNNESIKIQERSILLARNNVSKANTGHLPTLDAVGSASYTNNFADLDLRTFQPEPPTINVSEGGVESTTVSAGVEAGYVLWDGGQRKHRYQLLEGLSEIEKARQEVLINEIYSGVSALFYEIVKLQNQEQLLKESIALNEERIQKIENRAAFGKANKLAIVQAQTSLRQDESALANISIVRSNLLLDLKDLINDENNNSYTLVADIDKPSLPNTDNWQESIRSNNPLCRLTQRGISVADIEVALSQTEGKPTLTSFANAGYFLQHNDVQQLKRIQTLGGTIGISARYNLYDGGSQKIKRQNAQINRDIKFMEQKQLYNRLFNSAKKELANMQLLQAQIDRENSNQQTYQENYDKVAERFKLGQLPEITLREAQLALTNSKTLIYNLKVDFAKSKTRYLLLMGNTLD
ncbi:MAG: TolC family protein [Bacteroidota bacterium]